MVAITINKLVAMGVAFLATSAIAAPLEDTSPGGLVERAPDDFAGEAEGLIMERDPNGVHQQYYYCDKYKYYEKYCVKIYYTEKHHKNYKHHDHGHGHGHYTKGCDNDYWGYYNKYCKHH